MKQGDNSTANYVAAVDEFVSRGVLPKAKRYLSKAQRTALDTFFIQEIVSGDVGAETEFYDKMFITRLSTDQSRMFYNEIHKCDSVKLFFPLIVRELHNLGNKVFYGPHSNEIVKDVSELLRFVCDFADREAGAESDLACRGSFVRCGIVIIARKIRRQIGNTTPYLNFIWDLCDQGFEGIYIIGSSKSENKEFIREICREACHGRRLMKVCEHSYTSHIMLDGIKHQVGTTLIALRNRDATHFISSDTVGQLLFQPFEKLKIEFTDSAQINSKRDSARPSTP